VTLLSLFLCSMSHQRKPEAWFQRRIIKAISHSWFYYVPVIWIPCHHGMARPRIANRGDGLQIWRVAANILNKQSRTANSERSSSLGDGRWSNNPHP
jgi:hypothetical protein